MSPAFVGTAAAENSSDAGAFTATPEAIIAFASPYALSLGLAAAVSSSAGGAGNAATISISISVLGSPNVGVVTVVRAGLCGLSAVLKNSPYAAFQPS